MLLFYLIVGFTSIFYNFFLYIVLHRFIAVTANTAGFYILYCEKQYSYLFAISYKLPFYNRFFTLLCRDDRMVWASISVTVDSSSVSSRGKSKALKTIFTFLVWFLTSRSSLTINSLLDQLYFLYCWVSESILSDDRRQVTAWLENRNIFCCILAETTRRKKTKICMWSANSLKQN